MNRYAVIFGYADGSNEGELAFVDAIDAGQAEEACREAVQPGSLWAECVFTMDPAPLY